MDKSYRKKNNNENASAVHVILQLEYKVISVKLHTVSEQLQLTFRVQSDDNRAEGGEGQQSQKNEGI